jgi:hypothetical protein
VNGGGRAETVGCLRGDLVGGQAAEGAADAAPWLLVRVSPGSEAGSGLALPQPVVAAMATAMQQAAPAGRSFTRSPFSKK